MKRQIFNTVLILGFNMHSFSQSFPPSASDGGTYIVKASEASIMINEIRLPNNFTLKFEEGITNVNWSVKRLKFGDNCMIDLRRSNEKPPKAKNGSDNKSRQPSWTEKGGRGGDGGRGIDGLNSIALVMVISELDTTSGSLWINFDGSPGGDGGNGGKGGIGGGWSCGAQGREKAGNGGEGGQGGKGGDGGDGGMAIKPKIKVLSMFGEKEIPVLTDCNNTEPSSRPLVKSYFSITANPGKPGEGGDRGIGGHGGDGPPSRYKDCGIFAGGVRGGADGKKGNKGNRGDINCVEMLGDSSGVEGLYSQALSRNYEDYYAANIHPLKDYRPELFNEIIKDGVITEKEFLKASEIINR